MSKSLRTELLARGFERIDAADPRALDESVTYRLGSVSLTLRNGSLNVSGGVILSAHNEACEITLHKLKADRGSRGTGEGSRVLGAFLAAIDARGLDVYLSPSAFESGSGLTDETLRRWYERFGFLALDGDGKVMARMRKK